MTPDRQCQQCLFDHQTLYYDTPWDETPEHSPVLGRYTGEWQYRTKETWSFINTPNYWAQQHDYGDHHGEFDDHKRWLDTPRPHAKLRCTNGHEWWVEGKPYKEEVAA
jgi:hypothetical protein